MRNTEDIFFGVGARIEKLEDQMKLFGDLIGKLIRNRCGLINAFCVASEALFGTLTELCKIRS